MKKFLLTVIPCAIAVLSHIANARALDYAAEADFFGESPVVLTVSRMHKPLTRSPASVSVIDREMIRNSGAREIADVLRMAPGMISGYLLGHTPVVTHLGQGEEFHRQLQVLIDGRSVFIPAFGGVPWANLPLLIEDIERIEITRGPNAVTYGSNAFLGTINIITRHAAEDAGGRIALTQQLDRRSGVNDTYVRIGDQFEDFDWRISAGRESDDGYDTRNDGKRLEKLNIRTDFLTASNQYWRIQAGINQSNFDVGNGSTTDIFRQARISNSFQNIQWELVNPNAQTTVKLTHSHNDYDDAFEIRNFVDPDINNPPVRSLFDQSHLSDRTDLEIYQNRKLGKQVTLNYGASVRKDEVTSRFGFSDDVTHSLETNNLFSSVEWKPRNSTTIDLGFLSEDQQGASREESFRFSAIQAIDNHHLRFVSSSARRLPILWEQSGRISFSASFEQALPPPFNQLPIEQPFVFQVNWVNNNQLRPESIISNEIGLLSEFLERQLTTDIKIFRYRISDQIIDEDVALNPPIFLVQALGANPLNPVLDDSTSVMINGGSTKVDGLEYSFNYSPRRASHRLYGALSLVKVDSFDKNTGNDIGDSYPDLTLYVGGHLNPVPDHELSSTVYHVDDMSWRNRNSQLKPYTRLDVRYQYTVDRKQDINIELIGYGVLDDYSDYRSSSEHKPEYLVKFSGRF